VLEAEVVYKISPNPSFPKRGNTPLDPLLIEGKTPPLENGDGGGFSDNKVVDIKLKKFVPSLAEVPTKELEALRERAIKSGFDFIDFWAVDFDIRTDNPLSITGRRTEQEKTARCRPSPITNTTNILRRANTRLALKSSISSVVIRV
jgi:hypothetical protein